MSRNKKSIAMAVAVVLAIAGENPPAWAKNITIWDGIGTQPASGSGEDGETEPNTVNNQSWDNEAFVVRDGRLIIVSGFDFVNGRVGNGITFTAGDVFIKTTPGPVGTGQNLGTVDGYFNLNNLNFNYQYALDLNISAGTYGVVKLNADATLKSGYYRQNDAANPFEFVSGGTTVTTKGLTYRTGLTDAQVATDYGSDVVVTGGSHNVVELDMSWWATEVGNAGGLNTHFNLGCGNDVLAGDAQGGFDTVPDGGSTLMLLGLGMGGLALVRGRLSRKS
jgi:hypothetical protein